MAEYIEREALLAEYDRLHTGEPGRARKLIAEAPAADVVEVVPELRKTVELLHNEYERAKQLDFVYDPLAYAVYQVWKAVDGRRKNGRVNDMAELKPCPFCGGTRLFVGTIAEIELQDETHEDYTFNSQNYAVVCNYNEGGCGAVSGCARSEAEAEEKWNRRAGE